MAGWTYGFQSNYYKGATNPKGETEFDFRVGDFEFNALNFDYLVVSGAKAQFKGLGKMKMNGIEQSGILFTLTVIDGQLTGGGGTDKIRMKVYNKNGEVYYDNQPGSDADNPVTPVDAGSTIVVVNNDPTTPAPAPTQLGGVEKTVIQEEVVATKFNMKAFPNPTTNQFNLQVESDNVKERINIRVFDLSGRTVELLWNITSGQTLKIGSKYRPGMYIVEMIQGNNRKQLKLLKQPD